MAPGFDNSTVDPSLLAGPSLLGDWFASGALHPPAAQQQLFSFSLFISLCIYRTTKGSREEIWKSHRSPFFLLRGCLHTRAETQREHKSTREIEREVPVRVRGREGGERERRGALALAFAVARWAGVVC